MSELTELVRDLRALAFRLEDAVVKLDLGPAPAPSVVAQTPARDEPPEAAEVVKDPNTGEIDYTATATAATADTPQETPAAPVAGDAGAGRPERQGNRPHPGNRLQRPCGGKPYRRAVRQLGRLRQWYTR